MAGASEAFSSKDAKAELGIAVVVSFPPLPTARPRDSDGSRDDMLIRDIRDMLAKLQQLSLACSGARDIPAPG